MKPDRLFAGLLSDCSDIECRQIEAFPLLFIRDGCKIQFHYSSTWFKFSVNGSYFSILFYAAFRPSCRGYLYPPAPDIIKIYYGHYFCRIAAAPSLPDKKTLPDPQIRKGHV
jgi:hypothetical protein